MEDNMGYLLQAMWLVIKSFFVAIGGAVNTVLGLNYKHYIVYAITGVLLSAIFAWGRKHDIWFGREGGKLLGVVLYAIICVILTPIINLFA